MAEAISPGQVINKTYLRSYVSDEEIRRFRDSLSVFFANYNEEESEEHNKNLVRDFLSASFYNDINAINTYNKTDFAIYSNVYSKGSVPVVLCEAKSARNPEMIDKDHLNRKALHELILYYLREEVTQKNYSIKHLIITDGINWFVFDKKNFLDVFARNKTFTQKVLTLDKSIEYRTKDIYQEIIKPYVDNIESKLKYTYFSLSSFKKYLEDDAILSNTRFRTIYKFLSPTNLLDLPFAADHNTLNRAFYNELLYIIGLEEIKDKSTNLLKIKRLRESKRQYYSLLEQTIVKLHDYGIHKEEEVFELALSLVLEWVNRILFLKLLEAQLKDFNGKKAKSLLCIDRIPDYGTFYHLCMLILAKHYDERDAKMKEKFPEVPYLNSSLFELTEDEKRYFSIDAITMGKMEVFDKTIVKNKGTKVSGEMSSLEYLFRFLGSYNFGADIEDTDASTIINASVLGLIFEKINGYKDGAFFTPGYITEYMCRESIRQIVIDKFNEAKGWKCKDFEELKAKVDNFSREDRIENNRIINSIKICDPAVGSGHFLVSALNEILCMKADLGILQDHSETPHRLTQHKLEIINDEITLIDEDGVQHKYDVKDKESQRIQETLFEEKKTIIENCLFGVDINLKSVEICRLRLWIELLKNAYYYTANDGNRYLQTLPNIDINIKHGNSLLSKYPVSVGKAVNSIMCAPKSLTEYKHAVAEYKGCSNKVRKAEIRQVIEDFKNSFIAEGNQLDLFSHKTKKDIVDSSIYSNSLEWMMDFPEILGEDGALEGFDLIIGNPPYVSLEEQKSISKLYSKLVQEKKGALEVKVYNTYDARGDLYILFIERALSLLKPNAILNYIIPNKWMKVGSAKGLRTLLLSKNLTRIVDFTDYQVFDEATTYTCILSLRNAPRENNFKCTSLNSVDSKKLSSEIIEKEEVFDYNTFNSGVWITSSVESHNLINRLKDENPSLGFVVGLNNYRGILTGLTDAFLITPEKRKELIVLDACSSLVIRPFLQGRNLRAFKNPEAENYVIFMPKGFTKKGMDISDDDAKPSEKDAWNWLSENYPAIASHLEPFAAKGRKRTDMGDYWWELRACTYYDKFTQSKIFYQVMPVKPCFVYDNSNQLCNNSVWFMPNQSKRLLALLNSDIAWYLMKEFCPRIQNGCQLIWDNFSQIPIPETLPVELETFADDLTRMLADGNEDAYSDTLNALNEYVKKLYKI